MHSLSFWFDPPQQVRMLDTGDEFDLIRRFEGGLAEVYMAVLRSDGTTHAVKMPRLQRPASGGQTQPEWNELPRERRAEIITGFRREVLIWVLLGRHPNIVQAHWFESCMRSNGSTHYVPALVMEFVESTPSGSSTLAAKHGVGLEPAIRYCAQAAAGLIHARSAIRQRTRRDFVHQDISPDNLLLTAEDTVKVTDFGLARVFGAVGGGKCAYMAPEQWLGKTTDERTDTYALGCILFELLEGTKAFPNCTRENGREQHLGARLALTGIATSGETVPQEVQDLVKRCLDKSMKKRPRLDQLFATLQTVHARISTEHRDLAPPPGELDAEDWHHMSVAFEGLGVYREAAEASDRAIRANPAEPKYWTLAGHVRLRLGDSGGAVQFYEKALAIQPDFPQALIGLGHVLIAEERFSEAVNCFNDAERADPQLPGAYLGRGMAHYFLEDIQGAVNDFRKAHELGCIGEANTALGNVALDHDKDPESALSYYDAAIEADPACIGAYRNMAKALRLLGRRAEAKACERTADRLEAALKM